MPYKIGQRVALRRDVDRYPHFIAKAGQRGTVSYNYQDDHGGTIAIRMDNTITHPDDDGVERPAAAEWNNEIQWDAFMDAAYPTLDALVDADVEKLPGAGTQKPGKR